MTGGALPAAAEARPPAVGLECRSDLLRQRRASVLAPKCNTALTRACLYLDLTQQSARRLFLRAGVPEEDGARVGCVSIAHTCALNFGVLKRDLNS